MILIDKSPLMHVLCLQLFLLTTQLYGVVVQIKSRFLGLLVIFLLTRLVQGCWELSFIHSMSGVALINNVCADKETERERRIEGVRKGEREDKDKEIERERR